MAHGLEEFCAACRRALAEHPGPDGRERVRSLLEGLLRDDAFVAHYCDAMPFGAHELYRDPELDFVVMSHSYSKGRVSPPHDHGASWAVYGQARGTTEMTAWERTDDGKTEGRADVRVARRFRLERAMAGVFEPGAIHQIDYTDGASFVRVTGTDLSAIPTRRYIPAEGRVVTARGLGPGPET